MILNFKFERLDPSGEIKLYLTEDRPAIRWSITHNRVTTKNVTMLVLPDDQQVTASIQPVDAKGQPAQVQGAPVWSSSNAAVAIVTAAADGMSALVVGGTIGTAQINVVADADLGAGITNISGLLDVQVVAGTAVSLSVSTGVLQPQPPPAPPVV